MSFESATQIQILDKHLHPVCMCACFIRHLHIYHTNVTIELLSRLLQAFQNQENIVMMGGYFKKIVQNYIPCLGVEASQCCPVKTFDFVNSQDGMVLLLLHYPTALVLDKVCRSQHNISALRTARLRIAIVYGAVPTVKLPV